MGYTKSIADNIKKYRLLNHMTQAEMATKLFLDTQYYAQLERGERSFTIEKIIQVCKLFQLEISDIIVIDSPNSTDTNQELISSINQTVETLTHSQLLALQQFLDCVLPLMK